MIQTVTFADGEVVGHRYRIVSMIGSGGMGEVYCAHDSLLKEDIALKTLRADLTRNEDVLRRFEREIQLARKVTHPNVCRIFEVGVHEFTGTGRPALRFFTMELLKGETLSARIRRLGAFSRAEAFPLAVQLAEGLQAAHAAGIVHTDFKSGNVILDATSGRAVITDFGLARLDPARLSTEATRTMSGVTPMVGTVAYMSPEQMKSGTITAASDIYSFGIVLFEMAAGKRPFDDQHLVNSAMQRVSGEGLAIRKVVPDIDGRWEAAIARCLRAKPERRFGSAAELANWFRDGARWKPRLWTRREWTRASLGAGILVASGGGLWMGLTREYQPAPAALEWYAKGVAALHSMTYETARRAFEEAISTDSRFALAHAGLARSYEEMDYSEDAKDSMLKAIRFAEETRLSKTDATRLRALQFVISRDYKQASFLFQQLERDASDRDKPAAALETGWMAERLADTEAASAAYERAVKSDPTYATARLRLGFILGRRRQIEDALASFREAERLYAASTDVEGVVETMVEQANLLSRSGRWADAKPVVEKALKTASSVGNKYQQIRLQLLLGRIVRDSGDPGRAGIIAREAIDEAVAQRMDNLATSGLVDLGSTFLRAGSPESAEPIFDRALEIAQRGKVRRYEASVSASLGSLFEQQNRPAEARRMIEKNALPFYRQAGYRREFVQSMGILGGALNQLGDFDQASRVLQEALTNAIKLHDPQVEGQVRQRLGEVLVDKGAWPEALQQFELAAGLLQSNGHVQIDLARLYWRLGRRADAEKSILAVAELLRANDNPQLAMELRMSQAEIACSDGNWAEALRISRQPSFPARPNALELNLRLIQALASIRTGRLSQGSDLAAKVTSEFERAGLIGYAASARLSTAEALGIAGSRDAASALAMEALAFFEPRQSWESIWRASAIVSRTTTDSTKEKAQQAAALEALSRLKGLWPAASVDGYQRRPDIQLLSRRLNSK